METIEDQVIFSQQFLDGITYWVCNRRNDSKALCPIPQISETVLTAAALRLHNKLMLHGQELLQSLLAQLREIRELELRSNQRLSDIDKEIVNISGQNTPPCTPVEVLPAPVPTHEQGFYQQGNGTCPACGGLCGTSSIRFHAPTQISPACLST